MLGTKIKLNLSNVRRVEPNQILASIFIAWDCALAETPVSTFMGD